MSAGSPTITAGRPAAEKLSQGKFDDWLVIGGRVPFAKVAFVHLPVAASTAVLLLISSFVPLKYMPIAPCAFRALTHYPCPLCGSTRTFVDMGTGHFAAGLHESPMAAGLYVFVVGLFLGSVAMLVARRDVRRGPQLLLTGKRKRAAMAALVAIVLANWIYRIASGLC